MTSNNYQLATPLRVQVAPRPLDEGSQVPPEETIWKDHQLSRGTVRKAIGLQLQEGLITRNQGRGTFIMLPPHYRFQFAQFQPGKAAAAAGSFQKILQSDICSDKGF